MIPFDRRPPEPTPIPTVLCCSGLDPTGGAGLQADLEAVLASGARPLSLVTALTVQDTTNVAAVHPVPVPVLDAQWRTLIADVPVRAVKIGLLGDAEQARWLAGVLADFAGPVVLDPVLRAGGGALLARPETLAALLPRVTVLTPNRAEAAALVPDVEDPVAQGEALRALGCTHVLVTGGDTPGEQVENVWIGPEGTAVFRWPRLPTTFHGAGCSLAAAIAAGLAEGQPVAEALEQAQRRVHGWLACAVALGRGRPIPNRRAPP